MLTMNNHSNYIRKELTVELLRNFFNDELKTQIDCMPIRRNPKKKTAKRCCVYRDRAITRYRIMALLGISIETQDDEYKALTDYLTDALEREKPGQPALTVISEACSSCDKTSYRVSDGCRGCLARPCSTNCSFDAVTFSNGRAVIDKEKCKNCGKCKDVCPFNSIIRVTVPCEENCPVGAVARDPDGHMSIDYDKCISCGRCSRSCPFGAVMERSHIIDTAKLLKQRSETVAMIAPSAIGQFPGSIGMLVSALRKAGFTAVFDVAGGAEQTAQSEAEEFIHRINNGVTGPMTTSCCPAWIDTALKHIPGMAENLSETPTPMFFTACEAAEKYPGAARIFIGPCTAKKNEAVRDGSAELVLSFEELGAIFIALGIDVNDCAESGFDNHEGGFPAKAFAASGGVTEAVRLRLGPEIRKTYAPLKIDGLSRKNINLLKVAAAGKLDCNMIEVMSCEGGCICGPGVICNPGVARKKLEEYSRSTA